MREFEWHIPEIPQPAEPSANFVREIQSRLYYALRALVKPTIKGEITKGKLRWRGIRREAYFVYGEWVYDMTICDDGSFNYLGIGRPIGEHPKRVWPVISQRSIQISLNFEKDDFLFAEYSFWKQKSATFSFGVSSRKKRSL